MCVLKGKGLVAKGCREEGEVVKIICSFGIVWRCGGYYMGIMVRIEA